ncbi:MAG: heme lyase CcmF/NrfE family subunit, partial [Pseudomonadota bacterium]|nr:heme lyase CcmF/NrfE family subunit [Pseudomonadota bacterium]
TFGIALGSWWAYYELGWGGWWFWDPVENASFMPWLVGTALMHSLAVTEKRAAFKNWTVLLAIISFSLSLLGTFLVRSGVLTSVHAFATDPARGVFILAFLGIVIGISFILYAWRAPSVGRGGHFELISREAALLFNNILFVVACAAVLLGTLYPLFLDALGMGKISVGPPYFGTVFFWIMLPVMILLGIGPLTRWKSDQIKNIILKVRWALIASVVLGGVLPLMFMGLAGLPAVPGITAAFWILLTSLQTTRERLAHKTNIWHGIRQLPRSFQGMNIAHIGVAVFIVGVILSNTYSIERDVRMQPGEPIHLGDYQFNFKGTTTVEGPNYEAERAEVEVLKKGQTIVVLHPEKRLYRVQRMPMTEAAIDWGFTRDIYVALGEALGDSGAWSVRVYYKPFIRWIWIGGLLMALGGLISATDKRYRQKRLLQAREATIASPA